MDGTADKVRALRDALEALRDDEIVQQARDIFREFPSLPHTTAVHAICASRGMPERLETDGPWRPRPLAPALMFPAETGSSAGLPGTTVT